TSRLQSPKRARERGSRSTRTGDFQPSYAPTWRPESLSERLLAARRERATRARVTDSASAGFPARCGVRPSSLRSLGPFENELGFDLLAASLRASSGDLSTFVEVLADKLERALPGRAKIGRRAVRLLSRERRVERIELEFGEDRYLLVVQGGGI